MSNVLFSKIDLFFLPWAASHELPVYTQAKGEETRAVLPVDGAGNEFEIWAVPEFRPDGSEVSVGAALRRRGNKQHTFFRERKNYHFCASVPEIDTGKALAEAWNMVKAWEQEFIRSGNA